MDITSLNKPPFDESWYLDRYPDVASAVSAGISPSAEVHYRDHGKGEGRLGYEFDKEWYRNSYPMVDRDLRAGRAADEQSHYEDIGRYRGYLPNPKARRPENPVVPYSRFGGLWTDWTDASDRLQGKLEVGLISQVQADQLTHFMRDGYVIIEGAIPDNLLAQATQELDKAYLGGFRDMLFECHNVSEKHSKWNPRMNDFPAKALDIHWFSPGIRSLIFAPKITSFLHALFESRAQASQSLGFLRGSAQPAHQDSAYVPYTLQRNFVASWIALEDVHEGAGELVYYPGSHRMADFLYCGKCKNIPEAHRIGLSREEAAADAARHVKDLPSRSKACGSREAQFLARKGDVLIWHADLPHGGKAISGTQTRKSIVTHYSPYYLAPLYFEGRRVTCHDHIGLGYYSSGYYGDETKV